MAEEQSEETKDEARTFMKGLVGSAPESTYEFKGGDGIDMEALRIIYTHTTNKSTLMNRFWNELYDPTQTSIWTCSYDEADSNEDLEQTIAIAEEFMKQTESIADHCFGIMHTLDNLEIRGLWIFNAANPERLFGINEDSSWFTFSQLGPEPNEYVKKAVANLLTPKDDKLDGKTIKNIQTL